MEVAKRTYHTSVALALCITFPLYIGGLPIPMSTTHMTITPSPLMTNRTTIQQIRKRQLSLTTKNTRMKDLVKKCTQWDDWVNSDTPDGSGDYEPFAEVAKHSKLCSNPIKIECLTTAGFQADDLGQIITCDLCSGLQCDNMNQFDQSGCADYKVRLACLKLTPECALPHTASTTIGTISSTKLTTNPPIKTLAKCYKDMDTSYCPDSCPDGQYCDGSECVLNCHCKVDGIIVESGSVVYVPGRQCAECWCFNGTISCYPFSCSSPCSIDEIEVEDLTSCTCTCKPKTCANNEFRCNDDHCIPVAKKCDGIYDCASFEDEDYCVPITPSPMPTTVPITTMTSPSTSAVTTSRTCTYNGIQFTTGQIWYDGCDLVCTCMNGTSGLYRCSDRCPTYANIPPHCMLVADPSDPLCCKIPQCTSPNKSIIPQGAFLQGSGLNLTPKPNLQQTPGGANTAVPQQNHNPTPYPGGTYAPGMIQSQISTLLPAAIVTPNHSITQPISTAPTPSPTHVPLTTLKTQSTPPVTTNSHNTQQFDNIKSSSTITRTETSESMILDGRQEQNRKDMNNVDTLCQFEFWIYIIIGFGSCLVLVLTIWLCWFCLRTNNAKVSDRKESY